MTGPPDPYRELGVRVTADLRTIRQAYLAGARSHHPDLGGNVRRMARVNEAWELLSDPVRRAEYDALAGVRPLAGEHWRGAAGRPPGRPSGSVLEFGIFAGWSLGEIARHDPGYLVWLSERKEGQPYLAELERYIDAVRQPRSSSAKATKGS
jgi:curved DNA-binding protein CbpA